MHLREPEGVELHPRSYEVSAYSTRPGELLLRGRVMDEKPPGVYFENDSEPLRYITWSLMYRFPFPI
ncbi:MAG: hypothetical protein ACKVKP_00555 [Acidimicrobiales bacterium]|jgi:hypothetical protein